MLNVRIPMRALLKQRGKNTADFLSLSKISTRKKPWFGVPTEEVKTQSVLGVLPFSGDDFKKIDPRVLPLVRVMLSYDPDDRPTARYVLVNLP